MVRLLSHRGPTAAVSIDDHSVGDPVLVLFWTLSVRLFPVVAEEYQRLPQKLPQNRPYRLMAPPASPRPPTKPSRVAEVLRMYSVPAGRERNQSSPLRRQRLHPHRHRSLRPTRPGNIQIDCPDVPSLFADHLIENPHSCGLSLLFYRVGQHTLRRKCKQPCAEGFLELRIMRRAPRLLKLRQNHENDAGRAPRGGELFLQLFLQITHGV
mmetsp:Transcript_19986/g.40168  ORF Transcript_19986/g.40168 Transcript_19986/m.40168 type:complete len:210 (-) Transcript_19986:1028-1657(-)